MGVGLPFLGLMFLGSVCFGGCLLWAWCQRPQRVVGAVAVAVASTYFVWAPLLFIATKPLERALAGPRPPPGATPPSTFAFELFATLTLVFVPGIVAALCAWAVTTSARVAGAVGLAGMLATALMYPVFAVAIQFLFVVVALWCAVSCAQVITWTLRNRRARRPPGVCRACGYDVRGLAERCPECGAPVAGPVRTPAGG